VTDLALERNGRGPRAVFIHGSFGWGRSTFGKQTPLHADHEVILVDRRGFGKSPSAEHLGWPVDADDLVGVLEEFGPCHLVGHSYGAVVALIAAQRRPERIRSLVVIEPSCLGVAAGDPDADRVAAAFEPVYRDAPAMTAMEFGRAWGAAIGRTAEVQSAWEARLTAADLAALEASRRERWPGDAPVDLGALRNAGFPITVVRGAWMPAVFPGGHPTGRAFAAVCHAIVTATVAREVVFSGSTHNPQIEEPGAFNALLREVWHEAETTVRLAPAR
jgi:pimeloyl-ACP methyl ester carboxylesterase